MGVCDAAGESAPSLFAAVAREAEPRLGEFKSQALANTAWAFATAGERALSLFAAVAREAEPRLGEFNSQALANTAWAFAAADVPSETFLSGPRFLEACATTPNFAPDLHLRQFHQYSLWLDERSLPWPRLPEALAARCHAAFCAVEGRPSRLQRDVVASLKKLGLEPQEEVRTSHGYSLDAVMRVDGRDVAVEVDGPSHFVGRQPTGATMLKRRQLRAFGWPLLSVPFWEWEATKTSASRREYLERKLRETLSGERPG